MSETNEMVETSEAEIAAHWKEEEFIHPTPAFVAQANMADSDACCGSAGIYNVAQPELAEQILQRKIDNVENTGAEMLVTANPGCMLQLADGIQRRGLACEVIHMATLFSRAYGL